MKKGAHTPKRWMKPSIRQYIEYFLLEFVYGYTHTHTRKNEGFVYSRGKNRGGKAGRICFFFEIKMRAL